MTTLGKILLFLNVAAAGAVAYFASDNWAKRQSLNATGLRYALTLRGLPTEPQPNQPAALTSAPADDATVAVRLPTGTGRFVDEVPFKLLKAQFADAAGKQFGDPLPPLSVIGELRRVDDALSKFLERPTDKEKRATWDPTPAQVDKGMDFLLDSPPVNGQGQKTRAERKPSSLGLLGLLTEGFAERQVLKDLLNFKFNQRGVEAERKAKYLKALVILDRRFDALLGAPAPTGPDPAVAQAQAAVTAAEEIAKRARDNELALIRKFKDEPDNTDLAAQVETAKQVTEEARGNVTAAAIAFQEAMAVTGQAATRDEPDRRRRALLFLSHLDWNAPDATWQKRVMLLFGQPEYVRAQTDRVERLTTFPSLIDDERHAGDAAFLAEYERLKQAAKDRDWIHEQQKELLAQVTAQVAAVKQLHVDRKKYLDERAAVVADLTTQVKTLAADQEAVESELFALQLRVGRLLRDNFDLEDRLITAERQVLPPGPGR